MSTMVMATQLSAQPSGYPVHEGSAGPIEPLILNLRCREQSGPCQAITTARGMVIGIIGSSIGAI